LNIVEITAPNPAILHIDNSQQIGMIFFVGGPNTRSL